MILYNDHGINVNLNTFVVNIPISDIWSQFCQTVLYLPVTVLSDSMCYFVDLSQFAVGSGQHKWHVLNYRASSHLPFLVWTC